MRNYLAGTIAATGLIIFIFGMDCSAQTVTRITADIPFDFFVGDELLPKGRYQIESTNRQAYPSPVIIRPVLRSTRKALIVPTVASSAPAGKGFSLSFNRYGSVHYLSMINSGTDDVAVRLARTSTEKTLARNSERPVPVMIRPTTVAGR